MKSRKKCKSMKMYKYEKHKVFSLLFELFANVECFGFMKT